MSAVGTAVDVYKRQDVLRVEQAIQKLQPENRLWGVGVVGHGETVADDFRLSLRKGSVQKKCAIGKMNPIRLRGKILRPVSYTHLDVYKRQTWTCYPSRRRSDSGCNSWKIDLIMRNLHGSMTGFPHRS